MEDGYLDCVGTSQSMALPLVSNSIIRENVVGNIKSFARSKVHTQTPGELCALAHKYTASAGFCICEFRASRSTAGRAKMYICRRCAEIIGATRGMRKHLTKLWIHVGVDITDIRRLGWYLAV